MARTRFPALLASGSLLFRFLSTKASIRFAAPPLVALHALAEWSARPPPTIQNVSPCLAGSDPSPLPPHPRSALQDRRGAGRTNRSRRSLAASARPPPLP